MLLNLFLTREDLFEAFEFFGRLLLSLIHMFHESGVAKLPPVSKLKRLLGGEKLWRLQLEGTAEGRYSTRCGS